MPWDLSTCPGLSINPMPHSPQPSDLSELFHILSVRQAHPNPKGFSGLGFEVFFFLTSTRSPLRSSIRKVQLDPYESRRLDDCSCENPSMMRRSPPSRAKQDTACSALIQSWLEARCVSNSAYECADMSWNQKGIGTGTA